MGRPKIMKTCVICEIQFYHPKKDVKCCSDNCRSILRERGKLIKYSHVCKICGVEFSSKSMASKYCSSACLYSSRLVLKNCVICESDYTGRKDSKTCSLKCKNALIQSRIEKMECFRCKKGFERASSLNGASKKAGRAFCSHSCANKQHVYELYGKQNKYSSDWGKTRMEVFDIYGNKCVRCDNVNNIEVHHTIPKRYFRETPKLSDNIEYLIPLCQECHKEAHRTHNDWFDEVYDEIEMKLNVKDIV